MECIEQIRASVLHGPKELRIVRILRTFILVQHIDKSQETRSISPPGPREAQVSVRATGLCGSDLHYYHDFRNGNIAVKEPFSLGHESAGVVVKVGEDVTTLQVGDKVALEVGLPCGRCDFCNKGRYNLCKDMNFLSSARKFPHSQGTLQDRINHPAAFCHK
jgi:L-iditol 2-dehydrogenase